MTMSFLSLQLSWGSFPYSIVATLLEMYIVATMLCLLGIMQVANDGSNEAVVKSMSMMSDRTES